MAAVDIIQLADTKTFLGEAGTGNDAKISRLITAASGTWERITGRPWMTATYTDKLFDGEGGDTLVLSHRPVTSVTKVEFPLSPSQDIWEEQSLTYLKINAEEGLEDEIYFLDRSFPKGPKTIRVSFVAGYTLASTPLIPEQIQQAVKMLVKDWWDNQDRDRPRIVSESLNGRTVTFAQGPLPLEVELIAKYYRDYY